MKAVNFRKAYLIVVLGVCLFCCPSLYGQELKGQIRSILGVFSNAISAKEFGKLPGGLTIIDIPGCRGIRIDALKFEIRVDTWTTDNGLMDRYKEAEASGQVIVASINGTFYSSRGMLGSAVSDGSIPLYPKQIPGSLSRCFVSAFRDVKLKQKWYIGETSLRGSKLLGDEFKEKAWINVDKIYGRIDQLLGGGGWIIQRRKDVHRESYERQRFLFRKEDQNSRHTVIAQDVDRNLFLLVFETGHTLHQIARKLTREKVFGDITEAIFLDGGSSSTIVLKGKYLVPPLYLMDKARFSSIQVIIPEERL